MRALAGDAPGEAADALLAPFVEMLRQLPMGDLPAGSAGAPSSSALQQALLALGTWITLATQRTLVLAAAEASRRDEGGQATTTLRERFDLLVECGDRAWLEIAGADGFSRALGAVLNESARSRLGRPGGSGPPPPAAPLQPPTPLTGIEKLLPDPPMLAAELARTQERLARAQAVLSGLENVGPGVTPREPAWSDEVATLNRMGGDLASRGGTPVLIVYALVNREHVLDLEENRSLVRELQRQGLDVWLLAWQPPCRPDAGLTLERYVEQAIGRAVDTVCGRRRRRQVNLVGVCQGGTLALMYGARHPDRVRRLATLVTPVDFHADGFLLASWLRYVDIDLVVDAYGNLPGSWLNLLFMGLRPLQLGSRKYLDALDRLADPEEASSFLRMERWLHDSPDQAGEAFRHYAGQLVRDNGFVNGTLTLAGEKVELGRLRCAVLNVAAGRDHIVPPAAVRRLGELLGGAAYRELVIETGHIGLFTSRRQVRVLAQALAGFMRARSRRAALEAGAC